MTKSKAKGLATIDASELPEDLRLAHLKEYEQLPLRHRLWIGYYRVKRKIGWFLHDLWMRVFL